MERQILQVRDFQSAFEAPMPDSPKMLELGRAKLRQKLLQEEVTELKKATDITEVADAICDILYITIGTAHEYGLADRITFLFDEVHRSNMTKMGEDGKPVYRKDGKVLKPETFSEPNLKRIINRRFALFGKDNPDWTPEFADVIKEIRLKEQERWNNTVQHAIKSKLKWYDKILLWINKKTENSLQKRVKVQHKHDAFFRKQVIINAYGKVSALIDA